MIKYLILFIGCLIGQQMFAQPLSSRDIRHASGKGPYPIYIGFQTSISGMKSTYGDFINDYAEAKRTEYPDLQKFETLQGLEGNLGVVINTQHFMDITNFRVNRVSLELGYRYLHRDLRAGTRRPLHLREDMATIRIGMRGNILYPLTYQLQGGLVVFHHTEAIDDVVNVAQLKTGAFPAGWDLRGRLMLFDPAGTAGGLGFFFEYRYMITSKGRDLTELYREILNLDDGPVKSWNYSSWSVGVVVPLALRWL